MTDLRQLLDKLEDKRLDYVICRSKVNSDRQGFLDAGISKATFYTWTEEERNYLNDIAQKVKREAATRALMVLQDAAEDAAKTLVDGLKSRNDHVKIDAAKDILDRTAGKAQNKVDVTSNGETIVVKLVQDE